MPRVASNTFKRKVKFYDENFDVKEDYASGTVTTASSIDEAKSLFGNDDAAVLKALNTVLKAQQIQNAVDAKTGGMEEKYILGYIKPMRMTEPFNAIESTADQTRAILEQIKAIPFLLNGLKSYCKIRAAEEAEGETEDTE